jgi:hypothetical protein
VTHHVLIELIITGDERDETGVLAATGPPGSLVGRHLRPRIAIEEHGIEPADVDAEFERVRTPDSSDRSTVQAGFDGLALLGFEGGLVSGDRLGEFAFAALPKAVRGPVGVALGTLSRAGEHERLVAIDEQVTEQGHRFGVRGAPITAG